MGCGTSSRATVEKAKFAISQENGRETGDLKLSYSKITYSGLQLTRLNEKFSKLVQIASSSEILKERQAQHVSVVVERLVQRLICNVGTLDPRFSSKFLISLKSLQNQATGKAKRLSFKYLVRLDAISTPALYPECFEAPVKVMEGSGMDSLPQGYVKVRVHGEYLEEWSEFINPNGLLRRDKVQERFVELLARSAACPAEPFCPAEVDESRLCGSPGKIIDPITLHHILKLPPSHHVFYGAAECNESRFPDPRDFSIAIVEGTPETRLHVAFLSPMAQTLIGEGDVEIVLTLGIGVTGWPLNTDFPSRYPLDHVDVILGYQSVQMDYFVVPKGPHHTVLCDDRSSVWEIRALTTEMFLEYHYSATSAVGRIFKILHVLLQSLRSRGVKTINSYILKNLIFFELETKREMEQWMPKSISRRVLSILDYLLCGLRSQMLPSYLFKRKNLLQQENALEEDYVSDGDILENYLLQLSQEGIWKDDNEKCHIAIKDQLENVMLEKWSNVISNLMPPISNRGSRLSAMGNGRTSIGYTQRQMEYIAILFREILKLKHIQQRQSGKEFPVNGKEEELPEQISSREDFIFLLQIMFNQAKQKISSETTSHLGSKDSAGNRKRFKLSQAIRSFDASTSMMIDDIRRKKEVSHCYRDDMTLVAKVIETLYSASDSDGRILGSILRPYLNQLFKGSHENCWFLPEWKKKMKELEFEAIGAFSSLVVAGNIDPLSGVLDSAKKGWNWAKSCIQIMQSIKNENSASVIVGEKLDCSESGLRMIFTPSLRKTIRCTVVLPRVDYLQLEEPENTCGTPCSTLKSTCRRKIRTTSCGTLKSFSGALQQSATGLQKEIQCSVFEKRPPHAKLRDSNPFTLASMEGRRQGSHRGLGSIVQALISLQKLTVLQEISQFLPCDEKRKVLNDIKKLYKEVQRLTVSNCRRRNLTLASGDVTRGSVKCRESREGSRSAKPRWKSATLPVKIRKSLGGNNADECEQIEIYRSTNEFSTKAETILEMGRKERQAEDELGRIRDDTLLGTCRLLRKHERQRVFGVKGCDLSPNPCRLGKMPSAVPGSALNTPFYLRATTLDGRGGNGAKIRGHDADFMQF